MLRTVSPWFCACLLAGTLAFACTSPRDSDVVTPERDAQAMGTMADAAGADAPQVSPGDKDAALFSPVDAPATPVKPIDAAACTPGTKRCTGADAELCSIKGDWTLVETCTSSACVGGACVGTCVPGAKRCQPMSTTAVQTCDPMGQWSVATACPAGLPFCSAGACGCQAGFALCGTKCVDLSIAISDCGRCGHSCLGGMCASGRCRAHQGSTVTGAGDIVMASPYVFFTDSGALNKVPAAGGAPSFVAPGSNLAHLAADATHVYVSVGDRAVSRVPLAGGDLSPLFVTPQYVQAMRAMDDGIYILETLSRTYVRKYAKQAGAIPVDLTSSTTIALSDLAVQAGFVYLMSGSDIIRVATTGGTPAIVASLPGESLQSIETDATHVWVTTNKGLRRAPLGAGTMVEMLAAGDSGSLIVDTSFVYWFRALNAYATCTGGSELMRLEKTSNAKPEILASVATCPTKAVDDAAGIYWLAGDTLLRTGK